MDFQRFLLIASSAAITLLLLIEWNAFKAERVIEPERQRVAEQETQTPGLAAETDLDTVVSSVEELPSVDSESTATPVSDEQSGKRYVTVTTDLLELVIDLNGGDVIETALLDYPDNIDTPDVPFVLLEQNSLRTYTAQSGLVGPDGIDSSSRAVFDSDAMSYQMQPGEPLKITLSHSAGGNVTIHKTFSFTPDNYAVNIAYEVANNNDAVWRAVPFAQIKRDNSPPPNMDTSGFGMQPFLGAATTTALQGANSSAVFK